MSIIEFTPERIAEVCALQEECFHDGWSEDMMKSAFQSGRYFGFLAYEDERLIGFIACTLGLDVCDLEGVAVLTEFRGKGIAKKLIGLALEKTLSCGVNSMMLEVRESNESAIGLYGKCGFEKISTRKKYYSDGENAVIMKKE